MYIIKKDGKYFYLEGSDVCWTNNKQAAHKFSIDEAIIIMERTYADCIVCE